MIYRRFGKTGWNVSQLSIGTVELGLDYGLYMPGEVRRPAKREAVQLLLYAFEQGINLVDSAPAYGDSEYIVGAALKQWPEHIYVATKVAKAPDKEPYSEGLLKRSIIHSIDNSLKCLNRERLDLVQIHNATVKDFRDGEVLTVLLGLQKQGKICAIGASVYGVSAALEALTRPEIDALQVAYNLLDQRMALEVFPKALANDVGILVRSALLKGVLTKRYTQLPDELFELRQAAEDCHIWSKETGDSLPQAAIRFCLSNDQASSILVGVRSLEELQAGLIAASKPPLNGMQLQSANLLAINAEPIIDPRTWGIP